uniref:Centrosomal protein CEP104 Zn finger domain-containing protein n=1 Tax=Physcomitrium patens TaxID=3218 RepID=A0A2K1IYB4_PHYPA|nr:hypothetical protein PHYPA_024082 [Physcomitrium patens]
MQENGWVHSQKQISSSEDTVDTVELEAYCESDNEHWLDYSIRPPQDKNMDSYLFFGKQDKCFKEDDNLDPHFCEQCPMLTGCCKCGKIAEISSLNDYYLFECVSGVMGLKMLLCLIISIGEV